MRRVDGVGCRAMFAAGAWHAAPLGWPGGGGSQQRQRSCHCTALSTTDPAAQREHSRLRLHCSSFMHQQPGCKLLHSPAGSPQFASCGSAAPRCAAGPAAVAASAAGPLLALATAGLSLLRAALRSVPSRPAPSGAECAAPAGSMGDHSGAPSRASAASPTCCAACGCCACCARCGGGVAAPAAFNASAGRAAAALSGRPRGVVNGVSRPAER